VHHSLAYIRFFYSLLFVSLMLGFSSCEKRSSTVIDSTGSVPILYASTFSLSVINTDTIDLGNEHKSSDLLTVNGIASVRVRIGSDDYLSSVNYTVRSESSSDILTSGCLQDNGVFPDLRTNDSIYTGNVAFQFTREHIGNYYVILWADSKAGFQSTSQYLPFTIVRLNHPPLLSSLLMDTIAAIGGGDQTLTLKIKATDPDGQADIKKVYFNSFKPNGSAASGNPFFMYDDGTNGDSVSHDSIFTLAVALPVGSAIGVYRFEFHAVDRFNDPSNTITQTIRIIN
jgi:hypothetical protein